jgi:Bacterial PH domain
MFHVERIRVTASPAPALVVGEMLGVLLAVVVAVLTDAAGRVVALAALVVLGAYAVRDLVLRPVLVADREALEVRSGLSAVRVSWGEVDRIRVVRDRRAELLELEVAGRIVLLSRWRLGRPPGEVCEALDALRSG